MCEKIISQEVTLSCEEQGDAVTCVTVSCPGQH
jgi:hypothetical protein